MSGYFPPIPDAFGRSLRSLPSKRSTWPSDNNTPVWKNSLIHSRGSRSSASSWQMSLRTRNEDGAGRIAGKGYGAAVKTREVPPGNTQ